MVCLGNDLCSNTSCPEICSAGFLILRSTGNTPVTHPLSGAYITSSRKASRGAHSTFLAATRRSKEVAEEALGPLTQGAQKGVGGAEGCSLTLSLSSPDTCSEGIPGEPGAGCRRGSLRAQSQVGALGALLDIPGSSGINPQRYNQSATFPNSPLYSAGVAETSNQENKHHTQRVGELRFIKPAGPEELTLQALSPEQRGYRVFIDRLGWATLAANSLV